MPYGDKFLLQLVLSLLEGVHEVSLFIDGCLSGL